MEIDDTVQVQGEMEAAGGQVGIIGRTVVVDAAVVDEVVVGGVLGVVVEVVVGRLVVVVVEAVVDVEERLVVDVGLVVVVDVTVVDDVVVVVQPVKPNELRLARTVPFEHLPPLT